MKMFNSKELFISNWRALKRNPLRYLHSKMTSFIYDVKCYFHPYNTVKCEKLPRSWSDRPELMFHTMFQILVDFVELEQPFVSWDDKTKYAIKHFTSRSVMYEFVEKWYNTDEGRASHYYDGISDNEKSEMDKHTAHLYKINKEILYLYEWYKDEKYEFDLSYYYRATGEKIQFKNGKMEHVKTGNLALITWNEMHEAEKEHKKLCELMLCRILEVRDYLWT